MTLGCQELVHERIPVPSQSLALLLPRSYHRCVIVRAWGTGVSHTVRPCVASERQEPVREHEPSHLTLTLTTHILHTRNPAAVQTPARTPLVVSPSSPLCLDPLRRRRRADAHTRASRRVATSPCLPGLASPSPPEDPAAVAAWRTRHRRTKPTEGVAAANPRACAVSNGRKGERMKERRKEEEEKKIRRREEMGHRSGLPSQL